MMTGGQSPLPQTNYYSTLLYVIKYVINIFPTHSPNIKLYLCLCI